MHPTYAIFEHTNVQTHIIEYMYHLPLENASLKSAILKLLISKEHNCSILIQNEQNRRPFFNVSMQSFYNLFGIVFYKQKSTKQYIVYRFILSTQ